MITANLRANQSPRVILLHMALAAFSLFVNGFGVYLTIQANIGAGPWDVLNLGISKSLGIPMFIDAVVVGKSVDFFNRLGLVKPCASLLTGVPVMLIGLVILAYTQYAYMIASLGCGPRDTLLVGLARRVPRVPIGAVSVALLSLATLIGGLLGGPVGVGTLICAFAAGPIMQMAFRSVRFDATGIRHQRLRDSAKILFGRRG